MNKHSKILSVLFVVIILVINYCWMQELKLRVDTLKLYVLANVGVIVALIMLKPVLGSASRNALRGGVVGYAISTIVWISLEALESAYFDERLSAAFDYNSVALIMAFLGYPIFLGVWVNGMAISFLLRVLGKG